MVKKVKTNTGRARRALTKKEIKRICNEVKNPLVYTIIWFGLNFGLRPREICNLKLQDIDFKEKRITVRSHFGNKTRRIPMTEKQARVLEDWITTRNSNPMEHDHVFHSLTYRKLTPASLGYILKNVSRKLGIRIYPYKLRYTCATTLWRNGIDIYIISKILGHFQRLTFDI